MGDVTILFLPLGARACSSGSSLPSCEKRFSGEYDFIHCSSSARWTGLSRTLPKGTWWERQLPSDLRPSTVFGPVQPLGERNTIMGHSGRDSSATPCASAACLMEAMRSRHLSSVAAKSLCVSSGSPRSVTKKGLCPYPTMRACSSASEMRARTVGFDILKPFK